MQDCHWWLFFLLSCLLLFQKNSSRFLLIFDVDCFCVEIVVDKIIKNSHQVLFKEKAQVKRMDQCNNVSSLMEFLVSVQLYIY